MKRYTQRTVTDREELKRHLKLVAEQGYAIDDEEMDVGVKCVGAPIRDYTRRIIGAVSISGPSMRFTDERLEKELLDISSREFLVMVLLAAAVLYMGVYPKPFTDVMQTSVTELLKHVALSKLN